MRCGRSFGRGVRENCGFWINFEGVGVSENAPINRTDEVRVEYYTWATLEPPSTSRAGGDPVMRVAEPDESAAERNVSKIE